MCAVTCILDVNATLREPPKESIPNDLKNEEEEMFSAIAYLFMLVSLCKLKSICNEEKTTAAGKVGN